MKNALISFGMLLSLFTIVTSTHAETRGCDASSVHCIRVIGLPSKADEGRYVKIAFPGQAPEVGCFNLSPGKPNSSGLEQSDIPQAMKVNISFYICKDASYSSCQLVSTDKLDIKRTSKGYVANPKEHTVNFTPYTASYPACTPNGDDNDFLEGAFK